MDLLPHYGRTSNAKILAKVFAAAARTGEPPRGRANYALRAACWEGNVDLVERLLGLGLTADDARAQGNEALIRACRYGHLAVVERLLSLGLTAADARARNNAALRWACRRGHLAVVDRLIELGLAAADVRAGDSAALRAACAHDRPDVVERLLPMLRKADVRVLNDEMFKVAYCRGRTAIITQLLRFDTLNEFDPDTSMYALYCEREVKMSRPHYRIVHDVIGGDPRLRSEYSLHAAMIAVATRYRCPREVAAIMCWGVTPTPQALTALTSLAVFVATHESIAADGDRQALTQAVEAVHAKWGDTPQLARAVAGLTHQESFVWRSIGVPDADLLLGYHLAVAYREKDAAAVDTVFARGLTARDVRGLAARAAAYEDTTLELACSRGDLDMVDRLLALGLTLDDVRARDNGALRMACIAGRLAVLERLVGLGLTAADARALDNEALRAASIGGHLPVVSRLLTLGLTADDVRSAGCEAPRQALAMGYHAVLDALLPGLTADDVRAQDNYMLREACARGDLALVERLLALGLTADDVAVYQHLPLFGAASGGHSAVVELLITGASGYRGLTSDVARTQAYGTTPLNAAVCSGSAETVQMLIRGVDRAPHYHGLAAADVRALDSLALKSARDRGRTDIVGELLDTGLTIADARECELFALACRTSSIGLAKRLVYMGLTIEDARPGFRALSPSTQSAIMDLFIGLIFDLGATADDLRAFDRLLLRFASCSPDRSLLERALDLGLSAEDARSQNYFILAMACNKCDAGLVSRIVDLAGGYPERLFEAALRKSYFGTRNYGYGEVAAVFVAHGAKPKGDCLRFAAGAFSPETLWHVLNAWEGSAELAEAEDTLRRFWKREAVEWESAKAAARDAPPKWARYDE